MIYLVDVHDVVPVQNVVAHAAEVSWSVSSAWCRWGVDLAGAAPKAIGRHGLRFERHDETWQCSVVVDV